MSIPAEQIPDVSRELEQINHLASSMREGTMGAREELAIACRSLLDQVETPAERIWKILWAEVRTALLLARTHSDVETL